MKRLHWALRRHRPAKVAVVGADGAERAVAVTSGRGAWARAAETAAALLEEHGGAVELRDAAGAVLARVPAPDDVGDRAEAGYREEPGSETQLDAMLRAQRLALEAQRELLRPLLDAYVQLGQAWADYAAQTAEWLRAAAALRAEREAAAAEAAQPTASLDADALIAQLLATRTGNGAPPREG